METTRKFTFNNETDKTAFMVVNPKRNNKIEKLRNCIKKGNICRTYEYKYLGEWYNEKGNHEKSLQEKEKKVEFMISKTKYYGDPYKVGQMALQVRLEIYKSTIIPTIYTNIETWSKTSKGEMERLEKMQRKILTSICEIPNSTPYAGLLSELGIWPIELLAEYKRIMLFHHILTSDKSRLIKQIINDQLEHTWSGCWTQKTIEICEKYRIQIENIKNTKREIFKRELKKVINNQHDKNIQKKQKRKQNWFCNNAQTENYINCLGYHDSKIILKLRLNMTELKCNYKNKNDTNIKCNLCKSENDTTEHLFTCNEIKKQIQNTPNIDIIKKQDSDSCTQLVNFIKKALRLKGINTTKTVKENIGDG